MASWEKAKGPDDPDVANCRNSIALMYIEQGRYDEALLELRRARASLEKSLPPEHPWLLGARISIGEVLRHQDRPREALAEQRPAFELMIKTLGADHPSTAIARARIGQSLLALHATAPAIEQLARALAVIETRLPNPRLLGEYRFAYARALADNGERASALEQARKAREAYLKLPRRYRQVAEIDAWLAARS